MKLRDDPFILNVPPRVGYGVWGKEVVATNDPEIELFRRGQHDLLSLLYVCLYSNIFRHNVYNFNDPVNVYSFFCYKYMICM